MVAQGLYYRRSGPLRWGNMDVAVHRAAGSRAWTLPATMSRSTATRPAPVLQQHRLIAQSTAEATAVSTDATANIEAPSTSASLAPSSSARTVAAMPSITPQQMLDALFGDLPPETSRTAVVFDIARQTGGPRLQSPLLATAAGGGAQRPPSGTLPLLFYLPGIDGTGLAASRQFPSLQAAFDLRCMLLPPSDRLTFEQLLQAVAQQIEADVAGSAAGRPVYLLGESFGGTLALALAHKLRCVDRVVLVNPATSFTRSPWPAAGPLLTALPDAAYRVLPVVLSPILSNPLAMAASALGGNSGLSPVEQAAELASGLIDLLPQLSSLRLVLPPETLRFRLQLLREGAEYVERVLPQVAQRVLLLASENDLLIPSREEAPRLARRLPRCRYKILAGRSHAMLQEAGIDLVDILKEEGFYVPQKQMSNGTESAGPGAHKAAGGSGGDGGKRAALGTGANFGTAGPLELPTERELDAAAEAAGLLNLKRLVSPVFFSTDGNGRIRQELDIPAGRPLLFVGNHQLLAPDMPLMVEAFMRAKPRRVLLRGLAHPLALGGGAAGGAGGGAGRGRSNTFGAFLETYGAVPVSGKALYSLLQQREAVLLYPGGVREAYKNKGEQYKLFWPKRAEFVRMAARFGATIVPFAGVGGEDGLNIVADAKELLALPLLGDAIRQQAAKMPQARQGVNATTDEERELFVSPLITPGVPSRFYFRFGAPIATSADMADDKEACEALYASIKADVESGIFWLRTKREQDPYKDLAARFLYEASWGFQRQAPTFIP